jgi:pilus assembly protein CpaF
MFSRFKKPESDATRGAATAAVTSPAPAAKLAGGVPQAAPGRATGQVRPMPTALPKPSAEVIAAEKEKKRKERLMELKVELHKRLLDNLNLAAIEHATEASLKQEIAAISAEALDEMSVSLNSADRSTLTQELYDEVMGLGPLESLLKDETVNDILVNGPQRVFVERSGRLELTDITFKDERHLLRIIDKIVSAVGRRVDESNPYCDARLADGSRFNCMVPPVAVDGSLVSIRKFKKEKLKVDDLVRFGAFTEGDGRLSAGRRGLPAQRHRFGRYGFGQDDHAERPVQLHRQPRARADHRGHGGTATAAGPCRPDGKPARRTSKARARSRSATVCAMRCGCAPTASSWAKPAARK